MSDVFDDTGAASTGMEQRRSLDSDEEASFDGPQWQTDYMFCDKANAMLVQHGTAVHQGTAVPKGREKLHETHSLSKVQHEKNNESPGIDYFIRAESWSDDIKNLPFISSDVAIENINNGRLTIPIGATWDADELRELCYINFKNDYENLGYGKWDNYDHIWDCKPKPNTHALSERTRSVSSQPQKSPFPRKI